MHKINLKFVFQIAILSIFTAIIINLNYNTPRTNFLELITQFSLAFACFFGLMQSKLTIKGIIFIGILLRLVLLFGSPELSNDYYRFIWDGKLLINQINPYNYTPNELISQGLFMSDHNYRVLFHGMGDLSASNYSCYPVINQFLFAISASVSNNIYTNILVLKIIVILADIGVLWVGIKLLKKLKTPIKKIGWFFINPFIILEFTGNLHFEGVMIFFCLLTIYCIVHRKILLAAICFAIAVHIKLIPLLMLPFFFKPLKIKSTLVFLLSSTAVILLIGQVLLTTNNITNFMSSIELYFNSFQFNSSIFYWVNNLFSTNKGWDTTQLIGPILSKLVFIFILLLAFFKSYKTPRDLLTGILFALTIYYSFATTVHPWYISLVLVFSLFTNYKFGIVWSFLVMFSYWAYSSSTFEEHHLLNSFLYVILFTIISIEIKLNWKRDSIAIGARSFFNNN